MSVSYFVVPVVVVEVIGLLSLAFYGGWVFAFYISWRRYKRRYPLDFKGFFDYLRS